MPNFFFYFFLVEEYLSPSKFIEFFGLFCIPYMFLQAFHISLNVKKKNPIVLGIKNVKFTI